MMRKAKWGMAAGSLLAAAGLLAVAGLYQLDRQACIALPENVVPIALPEPKDGIVRFVALGDTGTGSAAQLKVAQGVKRLCKRQGCDFMVLLGDNFYRGGLAAPDDPRFRTLVSDPYGGLGFPIFAVLGNHDLKGDPEAQVLASLQNEQWKMPNFRYQFEVGAARFFATNSNCGVLEWLLLADHLPSSDEKWNFVLTHRAIHGTALHGDLHDLSEEIWDWLIEPNVDFTLSGHNHMMEYLEEPGFRPRYVVAGTSGGAELRRRKRAKADEPSEAIAHFSSYQPGFTWFSVSQQAVYVAFYDDRARMLYETTVSHRP